MRVTRLSVGTHECRASDVAALVKLGGGNDALVGDVFGALREFGEVAALPYYTVTRHRAREYSITIHKPIPWTDDDRPRRRAIGRQIVNREHDTD